MEKKSITSADYIPTLFSTLKEHLQRANSLPSTSEDILYMQSFPEYNSSILRIKQHTSSILNKLVRFITPNVDSVDFQEVTDSSDRCLEYVESGLDSLKGVHKPTTLLAKMAIQGVPKPQEMYQICVDNSSEIFLPKILEKPNAVMPLSIMISETGEYEHPYRYELEHLRINDWQLETPETANFYELDQNSLMIVDSHEAFKIMYKDLEEAKEIAIDLEHHSLRSYHGLVCLMQISTRKNDYIVDPFVLWDKIPSLLSIFTDPSKVKVLHGADSDIEWLQRDFGLYIVNMFDTGQAARELMFSSFSLAYLLKKYCDVTTDKSFQLADWRIRPLSSEMILYARMDTHYLLYIYDMLRKELQTKAIERKLTKNELIKNVLLRSRDISLKRYKKIDRRFEGLKRGLELLNINERQILEALMDWRDDLARKLDESPNYILRGRQMADLARKVPKDVDTMLKRLRDPCDIVKDRAEELFNLLVDASKDSKLFQRRMVDVTEEPNSTSITGIKEIKRIPTHSSYFVKFVATSSSNLFNFKEKPSEEISKRCTEIENSFPDIFNLLNISTEDIEEGQEIIEEIPDKEPEPVPKQEAIVSIQQKYSLPMKHKIKSNRMKIVPDKKIKLSDDRDSVRIGWLDDVKLVDPNKKHIKKRSRR
jgi:ribonuclease D